MHAPTSGALDTLPITRWHWRFVVLVGLGIFFDLYEVFLGGILAPVLAVQFHLDSFGKACVISAVFAGMFLGANILSMAADRFGRRRVFMTNLLVYSGFSLASAFAPDIVTFCVLRVLSGVGLGAELVLADTYLAELLPARSRGKMTAWSYTIGFLGVPVAAMLGGKLVVQHSILGLDGWRWLLVFGSFGALLVLCMRTALPESPRWLESRGRSVEAEAVVSAAVAKCPPDSNAQNLSGRQRSSLCADNSDVGGPKIKELLAIAYRDHRPRLAMLLIFQVLQTAAYYAFGILAPLVLINKGLDIAEALSYSALSFAGYPLGALASVLLVDRYERKYLVIASALGIAFFGIVFAGAANVAVAVIAGFLLTVVSNVFSTAMHIYQAEIFPTEIRATASGTAYSLSRATATLLPFVAIPILTTFGPVGVFWGSAILIIVLCLDVAILGPRTTGKKLEQL
ncbi:MFS transporter [Mycobacteroides immunogenum]|uniref:MFS transporter n=1 Tax=Mycobacteroides immunogenum TaxID=83262 RepID=A0A179VHL4_9MYCO|nr:MFS transporter [Mycobacteroides immunogenum]OAT69766.1 MFS transporter [Mycobacteroides immunogenum]